MSTMEETKTAATVSRRGFLGGIGAAALETSPPLSSPGIIIYTSALSVSPTIREKRSSTHWSLCSA